MQQGLITKIEKKFMVIKTEASDIERIKIRPKVKVGEKIAYTKKDIYHGFNRFSYKQAGASLSVLIMMAIVGGLIVTQFNQNRPYGVVSFDVNPSVNIEIDENNNVININQLNESEIVPANYTDYTLPEILPILTTKAVEANLLEPNEIILLSYTPINDNAPQANEAVEAYINQVKADYTVLYYSADKAYYDLAVDSNKTVGRYYLDEQLKKLDLTIEESSDYIQDAYKALQEKAPETIENIRVNPSVESTKPDDTSTEDTTNEPVEETTDDNTVEETTDDNTVDDTTTDTSEEEDNTDAVNEQKRQEAITAQKLLVDQRYNIYKTNKTTADAALVNVNNKKNELAGAAEVLKNQQVKYNNVNDAKQENISEKNSITKRLEADKEKDLTEAQNIKEQSIAAHSDIKSEIKILNNEASDLYDNAYEKHKDHMDVTVEQIIEVQVPLQTQIDELTNNGTTTGDPATIQEIELLQSIVDEFDVMIDIIYSLSGMLPQADYQFIGPYNDAYLEFDAARIAANKLDDQASSLEDKYDKVIKDAEAVYQEALTSIAVKYAPDYKRLNEIKDLLDGFEVVLPNFVISIDNAQTAIDTLNGSLEELTALYNQLKLKQDQSYQIYVKEKEILDQLESKD
jgi:hypothetical protein